MSEVYVCFNDSPSDPAYNPAQDSFLVVPNSNSYNDVDGNPCSPKNLYHKVPVIPESLQEFQDYCEVMGYRLEMASDGEIILHTGIIGK